MSDRASDHDVSDPGVTLLAEPEPAAAASSPRPRRRTKPLAKPPVRALAKQLGVDLAVVAGTGPQGSVTRDDLQAYAERARGRCARYGRGRPAWCRGDSGERETRVPIKGVRKMTAQAMVSSAFTAPHVTEFVTVDVTRTMRLVERLKADREFAGVKVSPLLIVAKALLLAVQRNPEINASWDEATQEIVVKHYVNLGIAAATPRGLVVPNIKDADALSLRELADALGPLTATAREGRTPPADMAGGTITITNVGVFGIDTGTPILNPGEAAILAFGAVRQQPWVHKGKVTPARGHDAGALLRPPAGRRRARARGSWPTWPGSSSTRPRPSSGPSVRHASSRARGHNPALTLTSSRPTPR